MRSQIAPWVAFRILKSRRAGRYAVLLTATAVASIALGMFALIIVMSVMLGFREELARKLLGFNAHITITKQESAKALTTNQIREMVSEAFLKDISPFVQGEVIAQSETTGELVAQGARVKGVSPAEPGQMSDVEYYFPEDSGGFADLESSAEKKRPAGVIVGAEVVPQLSIHPDFHDRIELIAPLAELMPNGELGPNRRQFEVAGVFRAGIFDYDSKYLLTSIEEARKLLGIQAVEGWQIRLNDAASTPAVVKILKPRLPAGWKIEGWHEQNKKLFAALKLERYAMGGVLLMMIVISSFAIIGVVLLVTSSRRKDIAILKSIGMKQGEIGRIFLIYAAYIGGAGSLLGFAGGVSACLAIKCFPIRLPASYYLDWLPVELNIPASVAFALAGVAIAALAALYPVREAVALKPAEILRYE